MASTPPAASATSPWYPWLAPATNGVDGVFAVDTFVTGLIDVLPVSPAPGAEPWRFDTGDPDPSTRPLMGNSAAAALVVDARSGARGRLPKWYLVTPAQLAVDPPDGLDTPCGR